MFHCCCLVQTPLLLFSSPDILPAVVSTHLLIIKLFISEFTLVVENVMLWSRKDHWYKNVSYLIVVSLLLQRKSDINTERL